MPLGRIDPPKKQVAENGGDHAVLVIADFGPHAQEIAELPLQLDYGDSFQRVAKIITYEGAIFPTGDSKWIHVTQRILPS